MTSGANLSREAVYKKSGWITLLLFLLPLGLYSKVAGHEFLRTYDDGSYVTENPLVREGISAKSIQWAFTEAHSANWHPLTWISHMLDCEFFGLDAGMHHLVNVLLHAIAGVLCFRALLALTGARGLSAFVALFFSIHPLRVESVAWVAERKDVLSGVFFFWMLLEYARYVRAPSPGRMWRVALPLGLGLMSKPMLVTAPAVLMLLDLWPLGRYQKERVANTNADTNEPATTPNHPGSPQETVPSDFGFQFPRGMWLSLREKWPLWLLVLLSSMVTVLAQRAGGAIRTLEAISLEDRLANLPLAYWEYLAKSVWPAGFAFYYPHPAIAAPGTRTFTSPAVWGAWLALIGVTLYFWRLRRKRPWLSVGWLWFLGMLVPVIGLLQVGAYRIANRYAYLPLIGIYLLLAWEMRERLSERALRLAAVAAGVLALAFSGRTWIEIGHWRDEETLYTRALAVTQGNWTAHSNLGVILQERGTLALAKGDAQQGRALLERARDHYKEVIHIAPRQADAHNNLGGLHLTLGAKTEAIRQLELALKIRPGFLEALLTRGLVHEQDREFEKAQALYKKAAEENPDEALAHYKLGDARYLLGRDTEALPSYRKALQLDPRLPETQAPRASCAGLMWALATTKDPGMRDPQRALDLMHRYERARGGRLNWQDLRVLAAAQASCGDFPAALDTLQRAAAGAGSPAAALEEDRAAYRRKQALQR